MYGVEMHYTVKTLLEKGKSQRYIAKTIGIHRKTIRRIKDCIEKGKPGPEPIQKERLLDTYKDQINDLIESGKTSVLIHEYLTKNRDVQVAYPTVVKYVRSLKHKEVYIPLICEPGEEAQVDFGYLGRFDKDGRMVKVWVFSMVLSHSRYSYNEIVLNQSVSIFITCHIHGFEYFGGVPEVVKIDNLKAGVITPSFYEPVIQHQYAEFLSHYGSSPVTARINRGQDKGKVESGIKYVKNNFLKRIEHSDYYRLGKDLREWTDNICNQRLHGTTRKIPAKVFEQVEKQALIKLPSERYEIYHTEQRKVNDYAHVAYKYNFYSVPYIYTGEQLIVKSNGCLVKIYRGNEIIAIHSLYHGQGKYITLEEHKPPYKQKKSREYYEERITAIGDNVRQFMNKLEQVKPRHWHEMLNGILSLEKSYDKESIDQSCARAIAYGAISYREVKNILENKLYKEQAEHVPITNLGGFGHKLKIYDKL
jgi:transposase